MTINTAARVAESFLTAKQQKNDFFQQAEDVEMKI
jgi:hypothetical protein